MLFWEDSNIESGRLIIRDSKSKRPYPLPLTYDLAKKLEAYRSEITPVKYVLKRLEGRSYSHIMEGKPISNKTVWDTWGRVARRAGLEKPELYTPRFGRHYFAAMWNKRGGNLEVLRRILRHKTLTYTQIYLNRLIFFEDIREEYDRIAGLPVQKPSLASTSSQEYREFCYDCDHFSVCKHKEEIALCVAASGCKYFKPRQPSLSSWSSSPFTKPSRTRSHRRQTYSRTA